jgi:berberine-like enzyme
VLVRAHVTIDELLFGQHLSGPGDPWLDRSWALAHGFGSGGVYPNFPEPTLDDPHDAYHRGNLSRLAAIKRHYDPERLLHFPQGI